MVNVRLEPGRRNIGKNAGRLVAQGMTVREAWEYAYQYFHRQNGRRMDHIHNRTQREQRAR